MQRPTMITTSNNKSFPTRYLLVLLLLVELQAIDSGGGGVDRHKKNYLL